MSCAAARIKRASHSGTLSAPAPEPGVVHADLKEFVPSYGNFRYAVFAPLKMPCLTHAAGDFAMAPLRLLQAIEPQGARPYSNPNHFASVFMPSSFRGRGWVIRIDPNCG